MDITCPPSPLGSQPWPFPRSLMSASSPFATTDICIDADEIAYATGYREGLDAKRSRASSPCRPQFSPPLIQAWRDCEPPSSDRPGPIRAVGSRGRPPLRTRLTGRTDSFGEHAPRISPHHPWPRRTARRDLLARIRGEEDTRAATMENRRNGELRFDQIAPVPIGPLGLHTCWRCTPERSPSR